VFVNNNKVVLPLSIDSLVTVINHSNVSWTLPLQLIKSSRKCVFFYLQYLAKQLGKVAHPSIFSTLQGLAHLAFILVLTVEDVSLKALRFGAPCFVMKIVYAFPMKIG